MQSHIPSSRILHCLRTKAPKYHLQVHSLVLVREQSVQTSSACCGDVGVCARVRHDCVSPTSPRPILGKAKPNQLCGEIESDAGCTLWNWDAGPTLEGMRNGHIVSPSWYCLGFLETPVRVEVTHI